MKSWLKGGLIGLLIFMAYRLYFVLVGECFLVVRQLMGGIASCDFNYLNIILTLIYAVILFVIGALTGWLVWRKK